MRILTLENSPELVSAKNAMFRSLLTFLIAYFCLMIPLVNIIAILVVLVAIVWYFVGVYKFSKITNSTIFEIFMLVVLLSFGLILICSIMIFMLMNGSIQHDSILMWISFIGVWYLCDIVIIYWLLWRATKEFAIRTGLPQFSIAYKFQLGALILGCITIALYVIAIDFSPLVNLNENARNLESVLNDMIEQSNMEVILYAFFIGLLGSIATMIGFVFWLLAHAKITQASVRDKNQTQNQTNTAQGYTDSTT